MYAIVITYTIDHFHMISWNIILARSLQIYSTTRGDI